MASENWNQEKINYLRYSNEESHKLVTESIETALLQLMARKSFEEISITEIVQRAGVSRTAFYKNYKTKEEVLTNYIERSMEAVYSCLQEHMNDGQEIFWKEVFDAVSLYADAYRLICKSSRKALLQDSFNQFALRFMDVLDEKNEYYLVYYAGGFSNIILRWIDTGMNESSEEMARIVMEV